MVSEEEKLLVLMKHQPYMTMFDIKEYVEMYTEGSPFGQQVPYKTDPVLGLRRFTFSEYVDFMMSGNDDDDL
jgi:hypothetical protein